MAEEIFENTALRSLNDFEWLAVASGSPSVEEQLETGDKAFFQAAVAS